jgi:hypothetical protein
VELAISGWQDSAAAAADKLFNGDTDSINNIHTTITNGQLVIGQGTYNKVDVSSYNSKVQEALYALAIPSLWQAAKSFPFILDAGPDSCNGNPVPDYLTDETATATGFCADDGHQYFLVATIDAVQSPDPEHYQFTAPPGLDSLDGISWGKLTKDTIIRGLVSFFAQPSILTITNENAHRSLNTYTANSRVNNPDIADPTSTDVVKDLTANDVEGSGIIRLPVCTGEMALAAWNTENADVNPGYPCITVLESTCDTYTYTGDSSCASPYVADCQQMIDNYQDSGTHTVDVGIQHGIANYRTCAFGVDGPAHGVAQYLVGLQDIINVVQAAIDNPTLYGDDKTLLGASGTMNCKATAGGSQEPVTWGIYVDPNWDGDKATCS